jgi:hypothetical protein
VRNGSEILDYYPFLQGIYISLRNTTAMSQMDNQETIRNVVKKMPQHCQHRWNRKATKKYVMGDELTTFADLLLFVKAESDVANSPMYSTSVMVDGHKKEKYNDKRYSGKDKKSAYNSYSNKRKILTSRIEPAACEYCGKSGHSCDVCFALKNEPLDKRIDFFKKQQVCFGCVKRRNTFGKIRWK